MFASFDVQTFETCQCCRWEPFITCGSSIKPISVAAPCGSFLLQQHQVCNKVPHKPHILWTKNHQCHQQNTKIKRLVFFSLPLSPQKSTEHKKQQKLDKNNRRLHPDVITLSSLVVAADGRAVRTVRQSLQELRGFVVKLQQWAGNKKGLGGTGISQKLDGNGLQVCVLTLMYPNLKLGKISQWAGTS